MSSARVSPSGCQSADDRILSKAARIHASTLVWREDGILVRGPSGAGKTTLALAFVAQGRRTGTFSRLVADDITLLRGAGGRLIAEPHEGIAGFVERRGLGILPVEHEPACVLRLVLDLVEGAPPRLPETDSLDISLLGTILPRLLLRRDAPATDNVYRALDFIAAFRARS